MQTLEEYNNKRRDQHLEIGGKLPKNGISCPKCGVELFDTNPWEILASYPPQKNIHCKECEYVGYRVA